MKTHRRAFLSLAFGMLAACTPAPFWAYIIYTQLTNPLVFDQQGSLLISCAIVPLATIGVLAFGVPAIAFCAATPAGGPWWRWVGPGLTVFGFLFAIGTCIGPQLLAINLR